MKPVSIILTEGKRTRKAEFNLPDCWEEVPDAGFLPLVSLYLKAPEQMDQYDKTVRAFMLLAGAKAWPVLKELVAEELLPLLKAVDWVFDRLELKRNRFPSLEYKAVHSFGFQFKAYFAGPADALDNMRFGEWIVADGHFVRYSQTESPEDLDALIAVIYRPRGRGPAYKTDHADYRGDIREKFNDQLLPGRIKNIATISELTKKAIFLWYASCRQQIISQYPDFFPAAVKKSEKQEGWFGLYDDLMGDPKFGGAEKLEDTFIHTVFASVNRSVVKMAELKEKYDL